LALKAERPVMLVLYKTQDSVATHFRCNGGIFSDSVVTNFLLLILTVKVFLKSVNIRWSYEYKNRVPFWATLYSTPASHHISPGAHYSPVLAACGRRSNVHTTL